MAISGYLRTAGGGYPIELLDALGIPLFVGEMPVWADRFSVIHGFVAYLLVATIAVHVAAVLHHTLFGGVNVLSRMWPPVASDRDDRPAGDDAHTGGTGGERARAGDSDAGARP